MKKSYEVKILDQKFVLKTDNDETHVKRIADYVNKIMHDIRQRSHTISTQNIAILGALNIAEEFFAHEEEIKTQISEWRDRLMQAVSPEAVESKQV